MGVAARRCRRVVEAAPEGIAFLDRAGLMSFANGALARFLGTTTDALVGATLLDFLDEEEALAMAGWLADLDSSRNQAREVRFRAADGRVVFGLLSGATERDLATDEEYGFVMIADITAQKRTEQRLREAREEVAFALRQKDVLLGELHHRVRNNLQVVSSLLYLQTTAASQRDALVTARDRVRTISLLHELLHHEPEQHALDLGLYVDGLCRELASVHAREERLRVVLVAEAESARVEVDTVVPCGLILNELVSNAFKHAFPDGRTGKITVTLRSHGDKVLLTVSDDGIGMADGCTGPSGLGLQLVRELAGQARATFELRTRAAGTLATVELPRSTG